MSSFPAFDAPLLGWAIDVKKDAQRRARNTTMGKIKVKVRGGRVTFGIVEYGYYQNAGVRGAVRTIAKVGKSQNEAIREGISTRKYSYRDKYPPPHVFAKPAARIAANSETISQRQAEFLISRSIYTMGFPTGRGYLGWLTKPFKAANKKYETELADELISLMDLAIFPEEKR